MLAWLGTFAAALGFTSAIVATGLWARRANATTASPGSADAATGLGAARLAVALMAASAACCVAVVEWALVTHDFSLRFVAENGSLTTPTYYTITSLWAAHDGSLLLWLLVLSGYVTVVAFRSTHRAAAGLHGWAMTVLCVVGAFFFALTLFTSHTFETVTAPPGGGPGPNPLLQSHPAMGIHPPLLYCGYVGLSVPFAYAVAALITGDAGRTWLVAVRRYTLVSWVALTAGIVMGAWWSYAVLGWGGYWAWDPVENASLMPWLVATALIHSTMVQRVRGALPAWNIALGLTAFLLACLGTFLTRSGVVISVHAFSESSVGPVLLGFVVALAIGVAALVLARSDRLGAPRPVGPLVSRGSAILLNNVFLSFLTVTVLLGTLFPLMAQAANGSEVSVGPPYYNRMAVPIALLLLLLMAIGPAVRWSGDRFDRLLRVFAAPIAVGASIVVVLVLAGLQGWTALLAFGLAGVVATSVGIEYARGFQAARGRSPDGWLRTFGGWLVRDRHRNGGLLSHLGIAVVVVGITASSAYTTSSLRTLNLGEQVSVDGVTARLTNIHRSLTPGTISTAARLSIHGRGVDATALQPALRYFPAQSATVASPGIRSGLSGDVYTTLLSVNRQGTQATIRLAVNPMVGWIWFGGAVLACGGLIALWPGGRRRSTRRGVARAPVPETTGQQSDRELVAR